MRNRPVKIYTAAQVRELDRRAIDAGTPGYELMQRAGRSALDCLRRSWPDAKRIAVLCGAGNNAGDGYVLARLARASGIETDTIALFDPKALRGDALLAWQDFVAAGGNTQEWSSAMLDTADVMVDAIFGIGLSRSLDSRLVACVQAINDAKKPVLALDIPSGVHADTGQVLGAAIKASRTLTFIGLKLGFYVGKGPRYVGEIEVDSLNVICADKDNDDNDGEVVALRLDRRLLIEAFPPRDRLAHKGTHGRVLIVGGGTEMAGAAALAAEAALRSGAGLVTVATRAANVAAIVGGRPELIVKGVETLDRFAPFAAAADAIAVGPGLGQDEWARAIFDAALASDRFLIVDADALNLLAQRPSARGRWILTPHPAEAARLLGASVDEVQADRLAAAQRIAARYNAIVVLKGACSIVAQPNAPANICDAGNPGMATAGMGDVLTGIVAALYAQLRDSPDCAWTAVRVGVLVHALAGDAAAEGGQRGLIASDLFPHLRGILNPHV